LIITSISSFRHHDSNHPHCHILATRNRFDGTVVSDSNNYRRSEKIVRELEKKYNLQTVKSSKLSKLKAPNKDELEMIERTGKPSKKLILQHQVKEALKQSATMSEFIRNLEKKTSMSYSTRQVQEGYQELPIWSLA
jgi:hypothetical protein